MKGKQEFWTTADGTVIPGEVVVDGDSLVPVAPIFRDVQAIRTKATAESERDDQRGANARWLLSILHEIDHANELRRQDWFTYFLLQLGVAVAKCDVRTVYGPTIEQRHDFARQGTFARQRTAKDDARDIRKEVLRLMSGGDRSLSEAKKLTEAKLGFGSKKIDRAVRGLCVASSGVHERHLYLTDDDECGRPGCVHAKQKSAR